MACCVGGEIIAYATTRIHLHAHIEPQRPSSSATGEPSTERDAHIHTLCNLILTRSSSNNNDDNDNSYKDRNEEVQGHSDAITLLGPAPSLRGCPLAVGGSVNAGKKTIDPLLV